MADWTGALEKIREHITELLPAALGALGLLLLGLLLASVLRLSTRKLLAAMMERLDRRSRLGEGLTRKRLREDAPRVIATFVFWVVLLFFAAAAMEQLPLPVVTGLLQSMAYYLPKVLLAVVVAFVGLGAASLANQWITQAAAAIGVEYAAALGRVAQVGIFVVALVVGAQQIGLGIAASSPPPFRSR